MSHNLPAERYRVDTYVLPNMVHINGKTLRGQ